MPQTQSNFVGVLRRCGFSIAGLAEELTRLSAMSPPESTLLIPNLGGYWVAYREARIPKGGGTVRLSVDLGTSAVLHCAACEAMETDSCAHPATVSIRRSHQGPPLTQFFAPTFGTIVAELSPYPGVQIYMPDGSMEMDVTFGQGIGFWLLMGGAVI